MQFYSFYVLKEHIEWRLPIVWFFKKIKIDKN
jgi:hypothetical protein